MGDRTLKPVNLGNIPGGGGGLTTTMTFVWKGSIGLTNERYRAAGFLTSLPQEGGVVEHKLTAPPKGGRQVRRAVPKAAVRQFEQAMEHGPLDAQLVEERHTSPQIPQPCANS